MALLLWTLALVGWCVVRVRTFATGEDPMIFVRKGVDMLEMGWFSPGFWDILGHEAPGHVTLLSVLAWLGGGTAAGAFQGFLALGTVMFCVYVLALARVFGRDAHLPIVMGVGVTLLGTPLNPHYLLIPFREAPAFLFAFIGVLLLLRERGTGRMPWFALGAGLCFLAALSCREPLFPIPVWATVWALARKERFPRRFRVAAACGGPILAVGGLSIAMWVFGGQPLIRQQTVALRFVADKVELEGLQWAWYLARTFAGFIRDQLHIWGIALLAVGAWAAARRRDHALFLLLLPGCTSLLFYVFLRYPNWRYLQESMILLSPIAGHGGVVLWRGLMARLRAPRARLAATWLGVATALCVLVFHTTRLRRIDPWGPKVSKAEALAMREELGAVIGRGDNLLFDARNPTLGGYLEMYTAGHVRNLTALEHMLEDPLRDFVFAPLDPASLDFRWRLVPAHQQQGALTHIVAGWHADLEPVGDFGHEPGRFELGGEAYQMYELRPFAATEVEIDVPGPSNQARIAWIDLLGCDPAGAQRLEIGDRVHEWRGNGWVGVWISASTNAPTPRLRVTSARPLPRRPQVISTPPGEPLELDFGVFSTPSTRAVFGEGFDVPPAGMMKDEPLLAQRGILRLPPVLGAPEGGGCHVCLFLKATHDEQAPVPVRATSAGVADFETQLEGPAPRLCLSTVVPTEEGAEFHIEQQSDPAVQAFRVLRVLLSVSAPNEQ